jgi:hypothetical protein
VRGVPEGVGMSWDGPIPHPCPMCGLQVYKRRKYCGDTCLARARQQEQKSKPKTDHWNCASDKCKHYAACKAAIRADKGCALPCFEGVEPIPVVGHDVTSEFDHLDMGAKVWREYER